MLSTDNIETTTSVPIKNVYGLPNFSPEREPGEDDASIAAAQTYLKWQGQLSALKRDQQPRIDIRMYKTYPEAKLSANEIRCAL